jgi:hypothetical protein
VYGAASLMFPSSAPRKRLRQQDIREHDATTSVFNEVSLDAQVDFFLYEGIALRLAESPYLRDWLSAFLQAGTGEVATRKAVATRALLRARQVKGQVIAKLRACRGVTVGIDGWTNVRHDKVLNLCPVGRSVAYYWDSMVLKRGASAEEQAAPVAQGLRSIIDARVLVVAIVTDNEPVNGAMYRLLVDDFPFLVHIPCAAHTLQLCVKKVLRLGPMAPMVKSLRALLLAFKRNKDVRILLKDQQGILRKGRQSLQLVTIVDTRWNSVLAAAKRVAELETCLRPCVPFIKAELSKEVYKGQYDDLAFSDESFWHPLVTLIDFLVPYQIATDTVQSDDATLGDVHRHFARLMCGAEEIPSAHVLAPVKHDVKAIIRKEWLDHVNVNAVILCCLFNFDPTYYSFPEQQRVDADDWFTEWGTKLIKHYRLSDYDDEKEITRALEQQRSQFLTREGLFHSLEQRRANMGDGKGHARRVWGSYLSTVPEISSCVLALLELTASEAAVERSFSRQGLVHSKARNRLTDDSVQVQMSFAFNTRALAISEGRPPPRRPTREGVAREGAELLDDDDIQRGTAMLSQGLADDEVEAAVDSDEEEDQRENVVEDAAPDSEVVQGEEQKEEQSFEQCIRGVVDRFCTASNVTLGFRWNGVREQLLHAYIVEAGVDVLLEDMKARVKDHLATMAARSNDGHLLE